MIMNMILTASMLISSAEYRGLMISEISTASVNDWVELFYYSETPSSLDISSLYVTMYYGSSQPLATEPVTIYSWDRPETPWDDRYVVVYPAMGDMADETDRTGDTNRNGRIDLYCANYHASFWNTDCVVAIDTDNIPDNGGIIDFVFYSNKDGSLHGSIQNYVSAAVTHGAWVMDENLHPEFSGADIGLKGLDSYRTLIRSSVNDTNSAADFVITSFQTPGRPNKTGGGASPGKLFKPEKKAVTIIPGDPRRFPSRINLRVYEQCEIKARVFNAAGIQVSQSPLYREVLPGNFSIELNPGNWPTGLYICRIEAVNTRKLLTDRATVLVTLSRYR